MIKKLFLCLTLGVLFCLSGCKIYTQYDIDQAYDRGYEAGREVWYDAGYYAGKESAEDYHEWNCYTEDDLVESYDEGYHDAEYDHEEDWGNGYVDGFYDGYGIGYDDAKDQQPKDPSAYY